MRRIKPIFLLLFFVAATTTSFALETGISFQLNNSTFNPTRDSNQSSFTNDYVSWGISLSADQQISDYFFASGGFFSDPILRNYAYAHVKYEETFFTIGIGPVLGFLNSPASILKPGLSTYVKIQAPGITYLDFRADSSLFGFFSPSNSFLDVEKDYYQEQSAVGIGYYVKNAICSINLSTRKYTERSGDFRVTDNLTEYYFKTEIFQKNRPFFINLVFKYKELTKTFNPVDTTITTDPVKHTMSSLALGTDVKVSLGTLFTVFAALESHLYTFNRDQLLTMSLLPPNYLFSFQMGTIVNLNELLEL